MNKNPLSGWPAWPRLTGGDPLGRGAAVQSPMSKGLRVRTTQADEVVGSVCPYCAVASGALLLAVWHDGPRASDRRWGTPVQLSGLALRPPGERPPRFPTFGMLLVAPGQAAPLLPQTASDAELPPMHSDIEYLKAIADTAMEAHDRCYVEQANSARTIPIPTLGVKTTQFDISPQQAQALFDSGRNAVAQFLSTWDFEAYIDRFRSGTTPTRRETLLRSKP